MSYQDFIILLGGVLPDTPLGKIIQIRSETDPEVIKHFTSGQKKIRDEWSMKMNDKVLKSMSDEEKAEQIRKIQNVLAKAFG